MMFVIEEYANGNECTYRLLNIEHLMLLLDDIRDKEQKESKDIPKIVVYKLGEELLDWS